MAIKWQHRRIWECKETRMKIRGLCQRSEKRPHWRNFFLKFRKAVGKKSKERGWRNKPRKAHVLKRREDFSDGPLVRNPPVSAGDTDSIPDPGGSHMLRGSQAHEPALWTLRPETREATAERTLHAAPGEQTPLATTRESPHAAVKTQRSRNQKSSIKSFQ